MKSVQYTHGIQPTLLFSSVTPKVMRSKSGCDAKLKSLSSLKGHHPFCWTKNVRFWYAAGFWGSVFFGVNFCRCTSKLIPCLIQSFWPLWHLSVGLQKLSKCFFPHFSTLRVSKFIIWTSLAKQLAFGFRNLHPWLAKLCSRTVTDNIFCQVRIKLWQPQPKGNDWHGRM